MSLGDRISRLRRERGWSQEELAQQLGVSRQSVSKWESGQSVPDLDKILTLSDIFGVSTDYLLKNEATPTPPQDSEDPGVRRLTMEEALHFIEVKDLTRKRISFATALCILSPIPLILLGAASEYWPHLVNETLAVSSGMIFLLVLCALAVALFISSGMMTSDYGWLDKECFAADPAVLEMAQQAKAEYRLVYGKSCIAATCTCILSVVPLFVGILFLDAHEFLAVLGLAALMIIASIGVYIFIRTGIRNAAYDKLLQQGDYSPEKKRHQNLLASIFWPIAVGLYLAYSLSTNDWARSWIIWPVAALLFVGLSAAWNLKQK